MRTINEEDLIKSIHPEIFEWRGIYKKSHTFLFFSQLKSVGVALTCYALLSHNIINSQR